GNSRAMVEGPDRRRVKVRLSPNAADYAALTNILAGDSAVRVASVAEIYPASISACATATDVQITGQNIWRTTDVVVGGKRLAGDSVVNMLPDMSGIVVTIGQAPYPSMDGKYVPVTLLTPYGRAGTRLELLDAKEGNGSCARPAANAGEKGKGGK
ncbi:MAG TPA: hypothetical protein VEW26_08980, partial [Allosphingosinicella sp.]|nr:hypothetical protein [Allosphingosinicella sp.]